MKLDDGWYWMAREIDKMPDDWPTALVKLIDALDGYIRSEEDSLAEAVADDQLTPAELIKARNDIVRHKNLLAELRQHSCYGPKLNHILASHP